MENGPRCCSQASLRNPLVGFAWLVPHLAKERDLSHILKDRLLSLLKDNPSFSEVGVGAPLLPRLGNTVSCILNDREATFVVVSCKTDT